jgi:hypothetical protein
MESEMHNAHGRRQRNETEITKCNTDEEIQIQKKASLTSSVVEVLFQMRITAIP